MTCKDRNSIAGQDFMHQQKDGRFRTRLLIRSCLAVLVSSPAYAQLETIRVRLELFSGGRIEGPVVDYNDHGVVVVAGEKPFVFAWSEVRPISAVAAKFAILAAARGGRDNVTAEDYFDLGLYALSRNHKERASTLFQTAKRLDPSMADHIRQALEDDRKSRVPAIGPREANELSNGQVKTVTVPTKGLAEQIDGATASCLASDNHNRSDPTLVRTPAHIRGKVMRIYRAFGTTVQEVLGKRMVAIESEHFLIWTDWPKFHRSRLLEQSEAMYMALCRQFDISMTESVFLAKCPLFCFESKARFLKFARMFDGYDGQDAIGYTRSIERNGHVHMVLLRRGRAEEDFDRFASTLVHEGTHAFIHRLYSPRLIPNWINEGLADLVAEKVLGDRCPAGEKATLLANQYVRFDWPVRNLMRSAGPIDVHQYPIAHSLIAYLASQGDADLRGFVKRLKNDESVAAALAAQYEGLTLEQFEQHWRAWIRTSN